MGDRAYLTGSRPDGGFKRCVFPCQKINPATGRPFERVCSVSVDPRFSGKSWTYSGSADAPTLSPSIDCDDKPCWHGFIIDGEVRP